MVLTRLRNVYLVHTTQCLKSILGPYYFFQCSIVGYPVYPFGGTKSVVLSTTSWLGGRNNFLGVAYLVIGAWCLIFGIFFLFHKYKNPRYVIYLYSTKLKIHSDLTKHEADVLIPSPLLLIVFIGLFYHCPVY